MQTAQIVSIVSAQKRTAIVNRYAELSSQMSALKKELDQAKMEAVDVLGEGEFATADAKLTIQWVSRPIFDQAKAKTFLTAGQLAQCAKDSEFYDVRCKTL